MLIFLILFFIYKKIINLGSPNFFIKVNKPLVDPLMKNIGYTETLLLVLHGYIL